MNKNRFPWIALVLGLMLSLLVAFGSMPAAGGHTRLPVLMLLLSCEFGFIVTLAGGATGLLQLRSQASQRTLIPVSVACLLLAIAFAYLGLELWSSLQVENVTPAGPG